MNEPDPPVDLLADHDAGLPVDPSVLDHPRARPVLDALAATRAELGAVPSVPVPPEVAAGWNAALTEAVLTEARVDRSDTPSAPIGQVRPGVPPRGSRGPGRTRRLRAPRPAAVAGLLLAVVLVVAGFVGVRSTPPSVTATQLGGIARAALGVHEAGPFADPARREACLRAVGPSGLAPDAPLAGGRSVEFEGRPGVLLVLITGRLATFHVVVVTPDCDALLADTVVGP